MYAFSIKEPALNDRRRRALSLIARNDAQRWELWRLPFPVAFMNLILLRRPSRRLPLPALITRRHAAIPITNIRLTPIITAMADRQLGWDSTAEAMAAGVKWAPEDLSSGMW